MRTLLSIVLTSRTQTSISIIGKFPSFLLVVLALFVGIVLPNSVGAQNSNNSDNEVATNIRVNYAFAPITNHPYIEVFWTRPFVAAHTRKYRVEAFIDGANTAQETFEKNIGGIGGLGCDNDDECFLSMRLDRERTFPARVSIKITRVLTDGTVKGPTQHHNPRPPVVLNFEERTVGANTVLTWSRRDEVDSFKLYTGPTRDSVTTLFRSLSFTNVGCSGFHGDKDCELRLRADTPGLNSYIRLASVGYGGETLSIVREVELLTNRNRSTDVPTVSSAGGRNVLVRWIRVSAPGASGGGNVKSRIYWGDNPNFTKATAEGKTAILNKGGGNGGDNCAANIDFNCEARLTLSRDGAHYFKITAVVNGIESNLFSPTSRRYLFDFQPDKPTTPRILLDSAPNSVVLNWNRKTRTEDGVPTHYRVFSARRANDQFSLVGQYDVVSLGCSSIGGVQCSIHYSYLAQGSHYYQVEPVRAGVVGTRSNISFRVSFIDAPPTRPPESNIARNIRLTYQYAVALGAYLEIRWTRPFPAAHTSKYRIQTFIGSSTTAQETFGGNDLAAVQCNTNSDSQCFFSIRLNGAHAFPAQVSAKITRIGRDGNTIGTTESLTPRPPALSGFAERTDGANTVLTWSRRDELSSFRLYTGATADSATTLFRNYSFTNANCTGDRNCEVRIPANSAGLNSYVQLAAVGYGGETRSGVQAVELLTNRNSYDQVPTATSGGGKDVLVRWIRASAPGAPAGGDVTGRIYWSDKPNFTKADSTGNSGVLTKGGGSNGDNCADGSDPDCEARLTLNRDGVYYFKIAAVVHGVESNLLSPISLKYLHDFQPDAPTNLRVVVAAEPTSVVLSWNRKNKAEDAIPTRYRVSTGAVSGFAFGSADSTSIVGVYSAAQVGCSSDGGVLCSIAYSDLPRGLNYYRVEAARSDFTGFGPASEQSAPFRIVPLPITATPTVVFKSANNNLNTVTVSWSKATVARNRQTGFRIYRGNSRDFDISTVPADVMTTVSSLAAAKCAGSDNACEFDISGIADGMYYYKIVSLNKISNVEELQSIASPAAFVQLSQVPPFIHAIANQTVTVNTPLSLTINAAPSNGDAVSYITKTKAECDATAVSGGTSTVDTPGSIDSTSGVLEWTPRISGLYFFCVAARDNDGDALALVRVIVSEPDFTLPEPSNAHIAGNIRLKYGYAPVTNHPYIEARWTRPFVAAATSKFLIETFIDGSDTAQTNTFGGSNLAAVECSSNSDNQCFQSISLDNALAFPAQVSLKITRIGRDGSSKLGTTAHLLPPPPAVDGFDEGTSGVHTVLTWGRRDELASFRIYTGATADSAMTLFRDNITLAQSNCAGGDRGCEYQIRADSEGLKGFVRVASVGYGGETLSSNAQGVELLRNRNDSTQVPTVVAAGGRNVLVKWIRLTAPGATFAGDVKSKIYWGDNPNFTKANAEGNTDILNKGGGANGDNCADGPDYDCETRLRLDRDGVYYFKIVAVVNDIESTLFSPTSEKYLHDFQPDKPTNLRGVVGTAPNSVILSWNRKISAEDAVPTHYKVFDGHIADFTPVIALGTYPIIDLGCSTRDGLRCSIRVSHLTRGSHYFRVEAIRSTISGPASDATSEFAFSGNPPTGVDQSIVAINPRVTYDTSVADTHLVVHWTRPRPAAETSRFFVQTYLDNSSNVQETFGGNNLRDVECDTDNQCRKRIPLTDARAYPTEVAIRITRIDANRNVVGSTGYLRPRPPAVSFFTEDTEGADTVLSWIRNNELSGFKIYTGATADSTTTLFDELTFEEVNCVGEVIGCRYEVRADIPGPKGVKLSGFVRVASVGYGGETNSPNAQGVELLRYRNSENEVPTVRSGGGKKVIVGWRKIERNNINTVLGRIYWGDNPDFTKVTAEGNSGILLSGSGDNCAASTDYDCQATLTLNRDGIYYFKIVAVLNGVESTTFSPTSRAYLHDFAPDKPTNLTVALSADNSAVLRWNRKTSDNDGIPTSYRIFSGRYASFPFGRVHPASIRGEPSAAEVNCTAVQGTQCQYTYRNFPGGLHYFRVQAQRGASGVNYGAVSDESAALAVAPFGIAEKPTTKIVNINTIAVSWSKRALTNNPQTGFKIYRGSGTNFAIAAVPASAVTTVSSLAEAGCVGSDDACTFNVTTPVGEYNYKVTTVNKIFGFTNIESIASPASGAVEGADTAPIANVVALEDLSLVVGGISDNNRIADFTDVDDTITYSITRATGTSATASIDSANGGITITSHATVVGTSTFIITATDTTNKSTTQTLSVTVTAPTTPGAPTASFATGEGIKVTWTKSANAVSYKIYRATSSTVDTTTAAISRTLRQARCDSDDSCEHTFTSGNSPGNHFFAIIASNATNVDSAVSPTSSVVTVAAFSCNNFDGVYSANLVPTNFSDCAIDTPIALTVDFAGTVSFDGTGGICSGTITNVSDLAATVTTPDAGNAHSYPGAGALHTLTWTPQDSQAGKTYRLCMQAENGISTTHDVLTFTVEGIIVIPPTRPTDFAGSYDADSGITLSWNQPAGATHFDIYRGTTTNFTVENPVVVNLEEAGGVSCTTTGDGCQYTFTTDNEAGDHYFRIRSRNVSGYSATVAAITVNVPVAALTPPTDFAGSYDADNGITLNWNQPAGATHFDIYRGTTNNFTVENPVVVTLEGAGGANCTATGDGCQYTFTTDNEPGDHYFRIRASNDSGNSATVAAITVNVPLPGTALTPPTDFTGSYSADGGVTLSWNQPAGATHFDIYRGTTANFTVENPVVVPLEEAGGADCTATGDGCQYTFTTDNEPGDHYFRIRASNDSGNSATVAAITVNVPAALTPPTDFAGSYNVNRGITLSWNQPAGATHFDIYRGTTTNFTVENPVVVTLEEAGGVSCAATGDGCQYIFTTDNEPGDHYFRIRSRNVNSNSATVAAITVNVRQPHPPIPPTNFTGTYSAGTGITLTWTKPAGATGFEIFRGNTPDFPEPNFDSANSTESGGATCITTGIDCQRIFTTGLTPGNHYFRIRAITADGISNATATITVNVPPLNPNRAPHLVGTLPAVTIEMGGATNTNSRDVSSNFADLDGDTLTFSASSSATNVATVEVSGTNNQTVTVTAVNIGTSTISVSARDPDDLAITQQYVVTVTQQASIVIIQPGTFSGAIAVSGGGNPEEGSALTAIGITVTDPDGDPAAGELSYQWQQSAAATGGWENAPGNSAEVTYQISNTQSQVNKYLRVVVSYSVSGGGRHESNSLGPIANTDDEASVSISAAVVGSASRVLVNDADDSAATVTTLQWQTCGSATTDCTNVPAPRGTALTYTPSASDANRYLKAIAIATRDRFAGTTVGLDSGDAILISTVGLEQVTEVALPEITRVVVDNIVSAINTRVNTLRSGITDTVSQLKIAEFIRVNGEAAMNGGIDSKRLLGNINFANALYGDGNNARSTVGVWLSGEYKSLSGESDDFAWDGNLTGFHIGSDYRLANDSFIGLAFSRQQGTFDLSNSKRNYEVNINTISPYIAWQVGQVDFIGSLGFGSGEGELLDETTNSRASHDIFTRSASLAAHGSILSGANADFRFKGDLLYSQTDIEQKGKPTQDLSVGRVRSGVVASYHGHQLSGGGILRPSIESMLRANFGDGVTGGGVELGGGLHYQSASGKVIVEGKARGVFGHSDEYEEWGVQGSVRVQPGADGQGLQLSLSPIYGQADSGVETLWRDGLLANTTTDDYKMRINTRLGYGITLRRHDSVLTPYSEANIGVSNRYRIGVNWIPTITTTGSAFDLDLMGEQSESENRYLLKGTVGF